MNILIRKATPADKNFLITAIIESEKSGSDIISYCTIFSITEEMFRNALSDMLDEDVDGQEFCISSYLIAEVDGEKAATIGGWVEKENGRSSKMIKSNLLMHFLGRDIVLNAAPNLKLMNEIDIPRDEYAMQLEVTYTVEKFRGLGLYGMLANERIRTKLEDYPFEKVQGIILKTNIKSMKPLMKIGFINAMEKQCSDPAIFKLLPSDTKVLMERKINTK